MLNSRFVPRKRVSEARILSKSSVWLSLFLVLVGCEMSPWANGPKAPRSQKKSEGREETEGVKDTKVSGKTAREKGSMGMRKAGQGGVQSSGKGGQQGKDNKKKSGLGIYTFLDSGETPKGIPWVGGKSAKVKIEIFSDYGCPFCKVGEDTMVKLLNKYQKKIKILFYQTPIPSLHPDSFMASQAALAAKAQGKYWPMHDLLYANRRAHSRSELIKYAQKLGLDVNRFKKELDSKKYIPEVRKEMAVGSKRGVKGTPTFFVNGQKIEGAAPMATFTKLIDAHLD